MKYSIAERFALYASQWFLGSRPSFSPPRDVQKELGPLLSEHARIVLPDSPDFEQFTKRPSNSNSPDCSVVVVPITEHDVSQSVKYANEHDIPFVAMTSSHGSWSGLSSMKGGMNIWMRNMTTLEIAPDGQSVRVGGGVRIYQLIEALAKAGKQTASGVCNCVGVAGPGLGAAFGAFKGQYGLGLDQIISARLVLANGEVITVSKDSNEDLYWALRGAGHNFGIVTELKYRIYDASMRPEWSYEFFEFPGDQADKVFESINSMMPEMPKYAMVVSIFMLDSNGTGKFMLESVYNGPFSEIEEYNRPIHDLKPLDVTSGTTDYLGLQKVLGFDMDSPPCNAMRNVFGMLEAMASSQPKLNPSRVLIEAYPIQDAATVPADSTAFAHREQRVLVTPLLRYKSETRDSDLDAEVASWGEKMRAGLLEHEDAHHVYVNYAVNEPLEAIYGYEPWRLQRLRKLKHAYDPDGRFNFYAPIH